MASSDRQKIIIDTDCGVDDAIALLLAFSSKEIAEVIAITCCWGNTCLDNVCSNVMRVLSVCKEKNIPIHRGCCRPLVKEEFSFSRSHGSDGLGNCAQEFSTGNLMEDDVPASVALVNLARKYPNQITLIAVGPLTNLAVAHRIDPEFTKNLKSISIMGGNYKGIGSKTEVSESNFYNDPDSADIVLTEASCPVVLVPWETCTEFGIPWDFYDELVKIDSPKAYFFKRITSNIKRIRDTCMVCDFLAVTAVLYPQVIKDSFKSHLRVECNGKLTRGLTVLMRDSPSTENKKKIEIITSYDMEILNKIRRKMLSENQISNL